MSSFDSSSQFTIVSSFTLSSDDLSSLTILYQALIGSSSLGLYLFFSNLVERNNLRSLSMNHNDLMVLLTFDQTKFLNARYKLEAIGLISTLYDKNTYTFTYLLKAPLTPKQFLADGTLGLYLCGEVGEKNFNFLVEKFKVNQIDKKKFIEISKTFDEVFESEIPEYKLNKGDNYILGRKPASGINIEKHDFNFDEFILGFNTGLLDLGITDTFKKQIISISYTYGFDEYDMHSLASSAINKAGYFDYKLLKKQAAALYQTRYSNLPTIKTKNLSDENKVIREMEEITGIDILRKHNPMHSDKELNLVTDLYTKISLPKVVINFLFDYVTKEQSGEIMPINYYIKVSQGWIKDGIITAQKAYEFVSGEYKVKNKMKKIYPNSKTIVKHEQWVEDYVNNISNEVEKLK